MGLPESSSARDASTAAVEYGRMVLTIWCVTAGKCCRNSRRRRRREFEKTGYGLLTFPMLSERGAAAGTDPMPRLQE
jgi:hypothetical protein